jgi:hypothetical protein
MWGDIAVSGWGGVKSLKKRLYKHDLRGVEATRESSEERKGLQQAGLSQLLKAKL